MQGTVHLGKPTAWRPSVPCHLPLLPGRWEPAQVRCGTTASGAPSPGKVACPCAVFVHVRVPYCVTWAQPEASWKQQLSPGPRYTAWSVASPEEGAEVGGGQRGPLWTAATLDSRPAAAA